MIQKPLKLKLKLIVPMLALFALTACDLMQEPKIPTWTNKIEFPLIKESVNLETLKDMDNILEQLYVDGSDTMTIFAYADTSEMDSQEVGDQLAFGDITQSFAQSVDDVTVTGSTINQSSAFEAVGVAPIEENIQSELGPIELSNIPETRTAPFKLNEIVPDVNDIPNGTTAEIPEGDLEPVNKPFEFTDFSSATFSGGTLDVRINNYMVISLGSPINIQLQQIVGPDTNNIPGGLLTWSDPIGSLDSSTQSLDLTGMTLPGEILIEVTGHTVGSNGVPILIDETAKNSSFNIVISGSDLVVSSATAKVPSQSIAESGNIELASSENKIQEAVIKSGSLAIEIVNAMEVSSELVINIESLQDPSAVAFSTTIPIPANQTVVDVSNIADYSLVMDVDQQEVLYSYQINTEDTGDDLVTLEQTDQVTVSIALYGETSGDDLFFKSITGIIEAQEIEEAGDISIESDSKLLNADISTGAITITIDNQVNQPGFLGLPTITLTIPELVDGNSNPLSGSLTLEPNPTSNVLNFDLADFALVFPDTATQVLTYTTLVTTPTGELGKYGLEDSIIVDIVVSDMEFASVTGFFSQDALVDSNEIALDEGTKLLEAVFESGDFALSMTNRIGVVADVEFQIDEFIHRTTNQPLSMSFRLQETLDPQITNLNLAEYKLMFTNVSPGVEQAIHYVSSVSLPADEEMTLTFGDSIIIEVDITNLALESVTGLIEPDTLVIERSEQVIEMPDMVSDLMFEQVNIDIDFNSTFTIPIELTLNLSATDSLGNTVEITETHSLTPLDDVIHVNAAELLNLHPEFIVSSGQAIVGGGSNPATIAKGQKMSPVMYINVPLSLIIEDPPFLEMDVTSMDSPLPEDETIGLEEFAVFADVTNMFEFGATVVVLASNDSLAFDSLTIEAGNAPTPDTLLTIELLPEENTDPTAERVLTEIILSKSKLTLLEEKLFLKPEVQLLGRTDDASGNALPSHFFTTDSLTIRTWGSVSYTINGEEL
ncbi:MAG: hypothetical protein U9Q77_05845 [Candidatus Marinimicrobia bacterium]|nr:hypothetical protein [Candidatus Neomarinimicrobiota bacterium]